MTLQQYSLTFIVEKSDVCGQGKGCLSKKTPACADALRHRQKRNISSRRIHFNVYFVFLSVYRCVEIIAKEGRSLKELYLVSCKITDHGRILSVAVICQHYYHNHHCPHPQQWSHLFLWLGSYETRKR